MTIRFDYSPPPDEPAVCNLRYCLPQEVDQFQGQVDGLQSELVAETRRREEAVLHVEEKDAELAGALARLGEYERVTMCALN